MGSAIILSTIFALQTTALPLSLDIETAGSAKYTFQHSARRQALPVLGSEEAKRASAARENCGVQACRAFNAEDQFVSTSGEHAYVKPGPSDIRGPCPGLNAAANHGYISRNGISNLQDTVIGLNQAFGMGADLSTLLAVLGITAAGDPLMGTWSIGGPPPANPLTEPILGQAQGISYSHNTYEGDVSIARADAYMNNGDAHSLDMARFAKAYGTSNDQGYYTMDSMAQHFLEKSKESEATNPLFFLAPIGGLVAPAAYSFVIAMMSNHTEEIPNGYFDQELFKQFFGVTGDSPDNFKWLPGQERIPDNWYRRPTINPYGVSNVFEDLIAGLLAYPESLRFGGNTNGPNTFVGVDVANLTGSVYNSRNLLEGDGMACFFGQALQSFISDFDNKALSVASAVNGIVNKAVTPVFRPLNCPTLDKFDQTPFNQFPGYKYDPKAANS